MPENSAKAREVSWVVIASVLLGFPSVYVCNQALGWSQQTFWYSVFVLHWLSFAACWILLKRAGVDPSEIGFEFGRQSRLLSWGLLALTLYGVVLACLSLGKPLDPLVQFMAPTPFGRFFWVLSSLTAGVCEEFVYRGFAIRMLQRKGLATPWAVGVATLSFVLMHGLPRTSWYPIYLFTMGVMFAMPFLWSGRLTISILLHAGFDIHSVLKV